MLITGVLIAESLRVGDRLEAVDLTLKTVWRAEAGDVEAGQPLAWTFIEFEAPRENADALATALSGALDPALGWYCDFRSGWYCDFRSPDETFVVFAHRVFRYPRGDRVRRAEVEAYARSVGVPEPQLDWPE